MVFGGWRKRGLLGVEELCIREKGWRWKGGDYGRMLVEKEDDGAEKDGQGK